MKPNGKWEEGEPWPERLAWVPKWARYTCASCSGPIVFPNPHTCPKEKEEPKP